MPAADICTIYKTGRYIIIIIIGGIINDRPERKALYTSSQNYNVYTHEYHYTYNTGTYAVLLKSISTL